jgi:large exoprotein involved in heme utilization and adhesion
MNGASIETSTEGSEGGNIEITSPGYLYLTDSEITTSVLDKDGEGGKINLTPEFVILDDGYIKADAFEGQGGKVSITTAGLYNNANGFYKYPQDEKFISALSQFGLDGEVQINTPDIDTLEGMFALPTNFMDISHLFKTGCTVRKIGDTFLNKGNHKVSANNLMDSRWASFYLDDDMSNQATKDNLLTSNLFNEQFSLTKQAFGSDKVTQ